jgi:aminopeptidase 2
MQLAMSPGLLSEPEIGVLMRPVVTHENGRGVLWAILKSEAWKEIPGLSLQKLFPLFQIVLDSFTTIEQYEDAKDFFGDKDTSVSSYSQSLKDALTRYKEFDAALNQSLDLILARFRWVERDREDVLDWLKRNGYYHQSQNGVTGSV